MARSSLREASVPRFALRRDEAAASLAISESLFDQWVLKKRMPKGRKIDGVVLWDAEEIRQAWVALRDREEVEDSNPFDGVIA